MSARRALAPAVLAALALFFVAAGCGDQIGEDPTPAADVRVEGSPVRLVASDEAYLVLYVSNQSYDDETVRIEVVVDDVAVVDDEFAVEGQHNWIQFPLAMEAGRHEVTARADSGATLRESFEVPGDEPRYAVLDHWGRGDGAELTWLFETEPIGFD